MMIIRGINVQASMHIIVNLAISGLLKKVGVSQPKNLPKLATGPKRCSNIDLPTIQLTATGLNIRGIKKAILKNFLPLICEFNNSANKKAIANSTKTART